MKKQASATGGNNSNGSSDGGDPSVTTCSQHILEFVCDSGEGAQTAGNMFAAVSARMGNGIWTVEIIPAEIEPPNRSRAGASGNRVRIGTGAVTNMGDAADVVVAFNEQVLYSRIDVGAFGPGTIVFAESKWGSSENEATRRAYQEALADFDARGYIVHEIPMEAECLKRVEDPRRGKNMWALGMICTIYSRDLDIAREEIAKRFGKKNAKAIQPNIDLLEAGAAWAEEHLSIRFDVPVEPTEKDFVAMNGNQAAALGIMASGIELCSMYPITPATSVSHFLAARFHEVGGFVHQAEDEIAAIGFALGAAYAGKTPVTVTSGPGFALKTEFVGLAVMAELPLVIVNVQRGGPSTGLPTRVEQGDLLASLYSATGDAPKIVLAASSIPECFHFMITARQLAETFRGPVIVLTDANLATGQCLFERPEVQEEWIAPPLDQSPWSPDVKPFDWDPETGISGRPVPGQRGGHYVLTGLAHDERSKVAYNSDINQRAMAMRSKKLATLQKSLKPPAIYGDEEGELLVVCWGSTRGAVEEAIDRVRADGGKVSAITLRFLSPLEPGLAEIFSRFEKVMTVEINYSDELDPSGKTDRRYAQLAWLLRATTLVDIDCWSRVPGIPLPPATIEAELRRRLRSTKTASEPKGRAAMPA
ncbi:MAG: 2-oxoacid:acceptor oxidoreductase subunit alpha [Myxococcales bacterium]|nr:2-oxoacid:acceptor oxidoreductase subunit alpha [Myxococcales bacterium]